MLRKSSRFGARFAHERTTMVAFARVTAVALFAVAGDPNTRRLESGIAFHCARKQRAPSSRTSRRNRCSGTRRCNILAKNGKTLPQTLALFVGCFGVNACFHQRKWG